MSPNTSRGKVTSKVRERILELGGEGRSHRQIEAILGAEGVVLTHRTVGVTLKAAKLEQERAKEARRGKGGGARGERARDRRGGAPGREKGGASGGDGGGADRGAGNVAPVLPANAGPLAEMLWDQLQAAREAERELRRKMISNDDPAGPWATTVGQVRQLIKALSELMPAAVSDPAADPNNVAARAATHDRVLQMVEAAEARLGLLCPRCMREVA